MKRLARTGAPWLAVMILLLAGLLTTFGGAAGRSHKIHARIAGPRIIVFGDSVAYGAGDTVRGGWVTRLGRFLAAAYPAAGLQVVNMATNGGNTHDLLLRLRDHHKKRISAALVLIAHGLNDYDEHIPTPVMASHLGAVIRLLRAGPHPPLIVLIGLPPITGLSPARLRVERSYTDVIRSVAADNHVGYFDQFDLWLALGNTAMYFLRKDHEHPNALGYVFTAESVAAYLEGAYFDRHGRVRMLRIPPPCTMRLFLAPIPCVRR